MHRFLFVVIAAALVLRCASGAAPISPADAPRIDHAGELREASQFVVNRYASRASAAGVKPPYVPRVVVKTTPGLIFFTRENQSITVPLWPEVPPEARTMFLSFAGGDAAEAEELFRLLFNWFFIPHEASHWIRAELGGDIDHYASEVEANDLAVAFWAGNPANGARLAALERILAEVIARVPDPTPPGMTPRDYFNTRYDELGQDPMKYGYFQFRFVLDSLRRRSALRFDEEIRKIAASK
jgi:hypothetical protein